MSVVPEAVVAAIEPWVGVEPQDTSSSWREGAAASVGSVDVVHKRNVEKDREGSRGKDFGNRSEDSNQWSSSASSLSSRESKSYNLPAAVVPAEVVGQRIRSSTTFEAVSELNLSIRRCVESRLAVPLVQGM